MTISKMFCENCFHPQIEFTVWCGEEFDKVSAEKRKEFWDYAMANLKIDCIEVSEYEGYVIGYCYNCTRKLMEEWAVHLGIPLWKIFE